MGITASHHKTISRVPKIVYVGYVGLWGCGDRSDYVRNRDIDHDIDNDGFHVFVGRSELCDDFLTSIAFFMLIIQFNSVLFGIFTD